MSDQSYQQALAAAQRWVGSIAGVVMVADGEEDGERVIEVYVTPTAEREVIPPRQDSVRVVIRESDDFVALMN